MRRWLYVWGPALIAAAICTAALTGMTAFYLSETWVAFVPASCVALGSFIGCSEALTAKRLAAREEAFGRLPCGGCKELDRLLTELTNEKRELREALATLSLPEDGR